jgi:hypothetical protein
VWDGGISLAQKQSFGTNKALMPFLIIVLNKILFWEIFKST